jgi:hypothetical protein
MKQFDMGEPSGVRLDPDGVPAETLERLRATALSFMDELQDMPTSARIRRVATLMEVSSVVLAAVPDPRTFGWAFNFVKGDRHTLLRRYLACEAPLGCVIA